MVRLSCLGLAAGLVSSVYGVEVPSDTPVSKLLATAQTYLSQGQTTDALAYYDAAVARADHHGAHLVPRRRPTDDRALARPPDERRPRPGYVHAPADREAQSGA